MLTDGLCTPRTIAHGSAACRGSARAVSARRFRCKSGRSRGPFWSCRWSMNVKSPFSDSVSVHAWGGLSRPRDEFTSFTSMALNYKQRGGLETMGLRH